MQPATSTVQLNTLVLSKVSSFILKHKQTLIYCYLVASLPLIYVALCILLVEVPQGRIIIIVPFTSLLWINFLLVFHETPWFKQHRALMKLRTYRRHHHPIKIHLGIDLLSDPRRKATRHRNFLTTPLTPSNLTNHYKPLSITQPYTETLKQIEALDQKCEPLRQALPSPYFTLGHSLYKHDDYLLCDLTPVLYFDYDALQELISP